LNHQNLSAVYVPRIGHNVAESFGGGIVKRASLVILISCLALSAFAKFRVKNIKNKEPDQFQSRVTAAGVTYAADLLLEGKDQKDYFYKELTPCDLIAVRLAVFNNGSKEVALTLKGIKLVGPDGDEFSVVEPETVAQAVLGGVQNASTVQASPTSIQVGPGSTGNPRMDPADPQYDPRLDPNSPRYDPNDPRNSGQYPSGSYPPATAPNTYPTAYPSGSNPSGGTWGNPSIVLNPGGGGNADLSQFEKQLAEKDFCDKAHTTEPVLVSTIRDRFLYFSVRSKLASKNGYTLLIPAGKGIPQEVVLKF
jgi:hypothetical protein